MRSNNSGEDGLCVLITRGRMAFAFYDGDSREPSGATDTTTAGVNCVLGTRQVPYQNNIRLQWHTMKIKVPSRPYCCLSRRPARSNNEGERSVSLEDKIKLASNTDCDDGNRTGKYTYSIHHRIQFIIVLSSEWEIKKEDNSSVRRWRDMVMIM